MGVSWMGWNMCSLLYNLDRSVNPQQDLGVFNGHDQYIGDLFLALVLPLRKHISPSFEY